MDKHQRFTLREIYEAAAAYQPDLRYKTLYFRMLKMKQRGELPESANVNNLTWEQGRMILRIPTRTRQDKPRKEAISILRKALKDDGIF